MSRRGDRKNPKKKKLSTRIRSVLPLIRPPFKAEFFVRATQEVMLTWSKMPWQWICDATTRGQTPEMTVMWEKATNLPILLAKYSLAHALKRPKGTPGTDPGGETVEFWSAMLEVFTVARGDDQRGYGRPLVNHYLEEALEHFHHPITILQLPERSGGLQGRPVIRDDDTQIVEKLRQQLRALIAKE